MVVGERDACQGLSVEGPVRPQHVGTETFGELGERRLTGLDDAAGHIVGVDDGPATVLEPCGDGGLAAADATRQPHQVHRCSSAPARVRCGG